MAGPVSSIVREGGCEYVYPRQDRYFAGVDNPSDLRLRLLEWHRALAVRVDAFVPASDEESEDLIYMRSIVDTMFQVVEHVTEVESRRWQSKHST